MNAVAGLQIPAPPPRVALALLGMLSLPVLFMGLGDYSVVNADEAFYHDVAWTMVESGNYWRVQTGLGEHVYDTFANAPLQYWARALVISWLGPGLFGMRILSAVAGLLAVFATYGLVLRSAGRGAALLAGLLLLTNHQFVFLHGGRTGELDSGVALLLVLIVWSFLRAIERPNAGFWLHHIGLVVLFAWKAPVIPIPVLAELVCFALLPTARPKFAAWIRTGVYLAPLALGWHAYQSWRLRAVLPDVFGAIGDQAGGEAALFDRVVDHGRYYLRRIGVGAWPQIALLPAAVASLMGTRAARDREGRLAVYVIAIQLVVVIGFYCAIAKVGPWYVIHTYPFLAALIAIGVVALEERRDLPVGALACLAFGIAGALFISPPLIGPHPFVESAIRVPAILEARSLGSLSTTASVVLAGAVLLSLGLATSRRRKSVREVVFAAMLVVVALALIRVAVPLNDLRQMTPEGALARDLAARRAAGQALPYPIDVPPAHPWIVQYTFGHDFELRGVPPRPGDPPAPRRRYEIVGEKAGEGVVLDALLSPRVDSDRRE